MSDMVLSDLVIEQIKNVRTLSLILQDMNAESEQTYNLDKSQDSSAVQFDTQKMEQNAALVNQMNAEIRVLEQQLIEIKQQVLDLIKEHPDSEIDGIALPQLFSEAEQKGGDSFVEEINKCLASFLTGLTTFEQLLTSVKIQIIQVMHAMHASE
jgi:hypothetical protein